MKSVIFTLLALFITVTSFAATRRYRLMHNSNPSAEITIGWEQQSGTNPVIHYGTVDQGTNFSLYPSTQAPHRQVAYMGMSNRFAKITGLTPNTVYYFVIQDSEGTSNRYWFTTMPNDNSQTLSFISGGDSRSGTTQRQNGNRMVAKIRPHAVLFGGDLVNTPGNASVQEWMDDWQLTITPDGQMIPVVHSYGNHEQYGTGGASFIYDLFDTPFDVYYNVRYGGDLFSCYTLNSEVLPGHTIPSNTVRVAQKNWLQSTLSNDASIWKFAQYHRPIVPHNSTKGEGADEYSDWANYFYDYGVRVVAESDAHCTKVTNEVKPAFPGSPSGGSGNWFVSTVPGVDDPNKGITFIGEGAWGTIRVADDLHPFTKASGSFYQFNWLLVDACKIEMLTIDTQSPNTVPQHAFGDYTSISAGLNAQIWKPTAIPAGVSTILRCNPPDAEFIANQTNIFTGTTVNFTDLSTGSPTSWSWNFGDGSPLSTLQNPSHTYTVAGAYNVTLTATNADGSDVMTKMAYIIVEEPTAPTANFVANITSATVGQTISLSDLSTGVPSSWSWNFGDALGTSTIQNPTYAYGAAGTYTVTLTATNIYGSDSEIKVAYITVNNSGSVFVEIANGNDDVEEKQSNGVLTYTSTDLEFVYDTWNSQNHQHVGLRFQNIDVPAGAVITNAYILMRADESHSTNVSIFMAGHAHENSPAWSGAYNVSARPRTSGEITWVFNAASAWVADVTQPQTPDISQIIQEIIDLPGWTSGNSMSFIFWGNLTNTNKRVADSYEGGWPAKLIFDYIVPAPPAPVANFSSSSTAVCQGSSISLTDMSTNNPVAWSWTVTGPETLTSTVQNPTFTFITPGTYSVELVASNAGGSDTYNQINLLTINPTPSTPSITAGGATTFCAGGSVTLSAPASASYLWSSGATTQSINATVAGSYTVQVTNASGCQSSASAATAVTVNPAPSTPSITAGGSTTFCAGGSVTLSAPASSSYLWSNGATIQSINATAAGSYTVQVTNASGCQSAASAATTVTVNPAPSTPSITAGGSTTFCAGGSVTLSAPAYSSYLWSNGATTQSINATVAGSYTVQVTNASGCQSSASASTTVTVNPTPSTPSITAGGATTFCAGGSVTLSAPASSSYLWSNGATTQSINATAAGSYTVQVTNASGCQSAGSAATAVTVNALPTIAAATVVDPNACATQTGSIEVAGSGLGNLTWTGSGSGSLNNVSLPATVNTLVAGSYSFTFVDVNTCSSNNLIVVLSDPTPPVTPTISLSGSTTFCAGGAVTLTSSESTGSTWSTSDVSSTLVVSTSGTFLVTYTDMNGCSATSAPVTVTVNPLPTTPSITAGGATTFCEGGSVTLSSSEMSNNVWSNTFTSNSINVSASGSYSVTYTDGNGCESTSAYLIVVVNSLPSVTLIELTDICVYADQFTLNGGLPVGGSYSGTGVSGSDFNPSLAGIGTHIISYEYSDANGCMNSSTSPIMVGECLGLSLIESSDYLIYPNPTSDKLIIECKCDFADAEVLIFDATGRLVHKKSVVADPTELDLSDWATGTYRVVLKSGKGIFTTQIIKQ